MPFRKTDTGPHGTYVLFDQLKELFPSAEVTINHDEPSKKFKNSYDYQTGYFVVAPFIQWTDNDLKALKSFLNKGNVLFMSAYLIDDKTQDWLGIKLASSFLDKGKDSIRISNFETGEKEKFFVGQSYAASISKYDSTAKDFQLIGTYSNGYANCISYKAYGGYVVIHTQPYMFSNYHLIKKKTKGYSELLFSSLPGPLQTIYWDESAKSNISSEMAPLRFIMNQPPLRNAFWWGVSGLLLLVLFSLKRRQRVIPVLSPLLNNSLDMVKTVSDMYYFSRRNDVIAKKKIAHWLEFLRVKYNIVSGHSPEIFWQSFMLRSNMSNEKANDLRAMVERFREGNETVSDAELLKLNKLIDSSY